MGTTLYAITNASLQGKNNPKDWDRILEQLKNARLNTTSDVDAHGDLIKEHGDWAYELEEDLEMPFSVDFYGPFQFSPVLYSNIGIIHSIYKYRLLYEIYDSDFFDEFRQELFKVVTAIGGTEVIFLADNSCDKLSHYLEGMAWENEPYTKIKQQLFKELGNPVTHYADLDYNKLAYNNITEFFLDDFKDLKN